MPTHAIMFTITTYGSWLRGDPRSWVDDGIIFLPDPALHANDKSNMKHDRYLFPRDNWWHIGKAMGESLIGRLNQRIYALTVQSWHSHGVIGTTRHHIADVIKCAKDAARWHLRIDRPIWGIDYDKRFCFNWSAVRGRINYVEKHNVQNGWPAKPWDFISTPPELLQN
jgi:hypothetical protein